MESTLAELLAKGLELSQRGSQVPVRCAGMCGGTVAPPARICEACAVARTRERRAADVLASVPKSHRDASFDHPDLAKWVKSPHALRTGKTMRDADRIVFVGGAGTGKTSLAVAMLRERVERTGVSAMFGSCFRLGMARSRSEDSDPGALRAAFTCDLLLLDDLGEDADVPSNPIKDIISARHEDALPTWITTGRRIEVLAARYGDGRARRMFEHAVIIDFDRGEP